MEIIKDQQFQRALRRIEKLNLKNHGQSLSATSMSNHCRDLIMEVRENDILVVRQGWRKELQTRFLDTTCPNTDWNPS